MSNQKAVNHVTYALESFEIDYIHKTEDGYEIVNITNNGETTQPYEAQYYESEEDALLDLVDRVIPESFVPYIEKMYGRKPTL